MRCLRQHRPAPQVCPWCAWASRLATQKRPALRHSQVKPGSVLDVSDRSSCAVLSSSLAICRLAPLCVQLKALALRCTCATVEHPPAPCLPAGAECLLQPGGYTCPKCKARVAELPSQVPLLLQRRMPQLLRV